MTFMNRAQIYKIHQTDCMTTHGVPVWCIRHSLLHKETKNRKKSLIVDYSQFKVVDLCGCSCGTVFLSARTIFCLVVKFLRIRETISGPNFDPLDRTGFHRSNSAFYLCRPFLFDEAPLVYVCSVFQ